MEAFKKCRASVSKAELHAVRKQRKAQRSKAEETPAASQPAPQNGATTPALARASADRPVSIEARQAQAHVPRGAPPPGFFDSAPSGHIPKPASQQTVAAVASAGDDAAPSRRARQPQDGEVTGAASNAPVPRAQALTAASELPRGFFDDKKADAIVHGDKPKTDRQKVAEFDKFQAQLDEMERQKAEEEEEEAAAAAERRRALEEFEHEQSLQTLQQLRKRKVLTDPEHALAGDVDVKRPFLQQRAAKAVKDSPEDGSTDDEDGDDIMDSLIVDWRAKR